MWSRESTRVLSIHVPHVGFAGWVFNLQIMFCVSFNSVVLCPPRVRRRRISPIVSDLQEELVVSRVASRRNLHGNMIRIIIVEIFHNNVLWIFVYGEAYQWIAARPTIVGHHALEVAINRKVKVSVVCWDCYLVGRRASSRIIFSLIVLLVVPVVRVSFIVSVMCDLEIVETS